MASGHEPALWLTDVVDPLPWHHRQGWMEASDCKAWTGILRERLAWEQPIVQVYGRSYPVPRLTMFLAAPEVAYRYSGVIHQGLGWPGWFQPLLEQINRTCSASFNGCLLNLYRHGDDRMGWHADDEAEIDASQPIASLSLGATRTFQFRHRQTRQRHDLELADGDLLVMDPGCQQQWLHGVPVRRRVQTLRINLTFRVFRGPEATTTTAAR